MKKNLVLTGMMGVGKSSIGKELSQRLNMEFKDVDTIIENKLSSTISEIFEKKGEDYFREIEEKESIDILNKKNFVVALGGGAFINEKIRKEINKNCVSFWLDLDIKIIFQRIKDSMKRPLLNNNTSELSIKKLYEGRKKIYSLSDFRIDCNSKTKNKIIEEVLGFYENI